MPGFDGTGPMKNKHGESKKCCHEGHHKHKHGKCCEGNHSHEKGKGLGLCGIETKEEKITFLETRIEAMQQQLSELKA